MHHITSTLAGLLRTFTTHRNPGGGGFWGQCGHIGGGRCVGADTGQLPARGHPQGPYPGRVLRTMVRLVYLTINVCFRYIIFSLVNFHCKCKVFIIPGKF